MIAELALKDIEVKIAKQEIGFDIKDDTLAKLFEEYSVYSKTNHAPNSIKRNRAAVDNFKRFLNYHPFLTKISHITPKILEDYKAFRKKEEAQNRTVNLELGVIRFMFNLAIKWGFALHNPMKEVFFLKEDKNKRQRFLNKEECRILLENCGDELYPIFYTFLNTGMRKSELEHLEWADVDLERRKIKIGIKTNWRPKTTEREIPISNGLLDVLKNHKEQTRKSSVVFHNGKGHLLSPNKLRKRLITITKRCGFPDVTKIHTLRHTFASHLVMSGVDLPTVKKLMGHSDIDTTMIYSHLADEHVDKAVERLKF
ncbi:MAG: site-specific integrase [Candidatus Omnitrophota bacterium]